MEKSSTSLAMEVLIHPNLYMGFAAVKTVDR
jgi:hypothetical protein